MTTVDRNAVFAAQLRQALVTLPAGANHPSEDEWARFAADEMSPDERAQIADHIVSCTECAVFFRVVSLIDADANGGGAAADRRHGFGDWRTLAAAAAVALTIGLGVWWAVRGGATTTGQLAGTATAPEPPAAAPVVDTPTAPSASWASLPAAPEVRLPADLVLAMRGADADRDAFLKAFGEAIAPYREKRFAAAAASLAPVAERYPDVVEAWFYLGTSRLFAGSPSEAIEPLRRARSSTVVGDDARWLEAVALQQSGRESEALAALKALCSEAGSYRERACAVSAP
jgi:TolA-binding protein